VGQVSKHITGRYRRDIVLVLILKAAGLYLLWILFFSTPHQVHPTPDSTAAQLLGANTSSPAQPPRGETHD
jgi:hypothetical protein